MSTPALAPSLRVDRQDEHARMDPMTHVRRFDHVGITVADLNTVTAFFVGLGFEVEGTRMFVEGEVLDTVIGIPDSRTEIVMLRPPDGGTRLELSSFVRPAHQPGSPAAMANELVCCTGNPCEKSSDWLEYLFGWLGPDEWFGVFVPS